LFTRPSYSTAQSPATCSNNRAV